MISPVKKRISCPKTTQFGPKLAFLFILGQALPAHLVGGCGTRAVSRKTPIYFIFTFCCAGYGRVAGLHVMSVLYHAQGPTGSRYPTRPDPKIENDWVPGNQISF